MGEYLEAFKYHENAVEIAQISLPVTHPDFQLYTKNLELIITEIENNLS
jgi:hypothetical protein